MCDCASCALRASWTAEERAAFDAEDAADEALEAFGMAPEPRLRGWDSGYGWIAAAAREAGLTPELVSKRLARGATTQEALQPRVPRSANLGKRHNRARVARAVLAERARRAGLSLALVRQRMYRGASMAEAFAPKVPRVENLRRAA